MKSRNIFGKCEHSQEAKCPIRYVAKWDGKETSPSLPFNSTLSPWHHLVEGAISEAQHLSKGIMPAVEERKKDDQQQKCPCGDGWRRWRFRDSENTKLTGNTKVKYIGRKANILDGSER